MEQLSDMTELLTFPREIGLKRQPCNSLSQFKEYIRKLNGKADLYTSLYGFTDLQDKDNTAIMDRAWWDFDSNDRYSIEQVKDDVAVLLSRLHGDARLVATGRGFHVHQLFTVPVDSRRWRHTIDRYQRKKAEGLVTLDGVGYPRKLCRIPHTYNATRGRFAVMVAADAFMATPRTTPIASRPNESPAAYLHPYWGAPRDSMFEEYGFDIREWAANNPVELMGDWNVQQVTVIEGTQEAIPMIPCLQREIELSNPPHHIRVALAQHLFEHLRNFSDPAALTAEQKDHMVDLAVAFITKLEWGDYNEAVTRKALRTLVSYGRSPSCAWFCKRGLCAAPCWRDDGTRRDFT